MTNTTDRDDFALAQAAMLNATGAEPARNHRWYLDGDGRAMSASVAAERLASAREGASNLPLTRWSIRSCWSCNPAHAHFLDDEGMGADWGFHCAMGCGRWYFDDVDITEYDDAERPRAGTEAS